MADHSKETYDLMNEVDRLRAVCLGWLTVALRADDGGERMSMSRADYERVCVPTMQAAMAGPVAGETYGEKVWRESCEAVAPNAFQELRRMARYAGAREGTAIRLGRKERAAVKAEREAYRACERELYESSMGISEKVDAECERELAALAGLPELPDTLFRAKIEWTGAESLVQTVCQVEQVAEYANGFISLRERDGFTIASVLTRRDDGTGILTKTVSKVELWYMSQVGDPTNFEPFEPPKSDKSQSWRDQPPLL